MPKKKGKAGTGKKGKRKKTGGKGESRVDKESEVERAKANAALWEARLQVTEFSRVEYREAARRLARNNEELTKHQYQIEKDTVDIIGFLKDQDQQKDELIEKLHQQLVIQKKETQEENEKMVEKYTQQLNELEEKFNKKTDEMRLIQGEMKVIKEFRKRKAQMEKELDDIKESMREANRQHKESLAWMEHRFFEEKQRLEKEAEKKTVLLAERAHNEAIVQLDERGRAVFKENVRLCEALSFHLSEAEELKKTNKKLMEERKVLLQEKETSDLLVQEKLVQAAQQKAQVAELQKKVERLETALSHTSREFKSELQKSEEKSLVQNHAGKVELEKLQKVLEMKDRQMNRVKKLARNILEERKEVERFFVEALGQVKMEIASSRQYYKQAAQVVYQRKMFDATAGREEFPRVRTFNVNEHSTNNVHQDLQEAEKWTNLQSGMVDISDLTWEQKEKVLRLLFAKMNGEKISDAQGSPSLTFLTQRVPSPEPSSHGGLLPDIQARCPVVG
ncbi:basal body-orientation factor 1 isoform X2 [Ambystoma mexicanum]|uniref:basal body-orientation factor 1 isoform X2 n=1 Tax=Ambystoma mexicanum TaxID=8296 RepID=UPI0037E7D7D8